MPSTWIPAAELASMRNAVDNVLPSSCIIYRLSESSDSQGGMIQTYTAVGTADCRLAAKQGTERMLAQQVAATGAFVLTVPYDTSIAASDRVSVGGKGYRVTFVDNVKEWRAAIRCDVDLEVP